jgi:hypothetical protein
MKGSIFKILSQLYYVLKFNGYLHDTFYRRKLLATVKEHEKYPCDTLVKEIRSRRSKLQLRIMKWRANQLILTPDIGNLILSEESCEIETERLFLPSDMDTVIRREVGAMELGIEEGKLRQGAAFDSLQATQNAVKTIKLLRDHKAKNCRGQAENTRSGKRIADVEARRDLHIQAYNAHRQAIVTLGTLGDNDMNFAFPFLEVKDTFMKSTFHKRQVGDSRRPDGALWSMPFRVKTRSSQVRSTDVDTTIHSGSRECNS